MFLLVVIIISRRTNLTALAFKQGIDLQDHRICYLLDLKYDIIRHPPQYEGLRNPTSLTLHHGSSTQEQVAPNIAKQNSQTTKYKAYHVLLLMHLVLWQALLGCLYLISG